MSGATSLATGKTYGVQRVCAVWEFARSTLYNSRRKGPLPKDRPGPKPNISDGELEERIGEDLQSSPFIGEGHRKVWARLKRQGAPVSRHRVFRVMKEKRWLSPYRSPKGDERVHDRHIITECPNEMWGTDGARVETVRDGWVWLFTVVEHWNSECLGWHVAKKGDRHAALEAVGNGLKHVFGTVHPQVAPGIALFLDNGPQYIAEAFSGQVREWGFVKSHSFVRQPKTNGVVEGFNRTLKEQLIQPLIVTYRPEGIDSWQPSSAHPSLPRSKDLASSRCALSDHHLSRPLDDRSQSGVKELDLLLGSGDPVDRQDLPSWVVAVGSD
ncbi:MAG: transposase [Parachlamydiales bacterium]